jgi:hypothetical protein
MQYYKFFKVFYEKTAYKNTIFVSENLYIYISYFYKLKKINQIQTVPKL